MILKIDTQGCEDQVLAGAERLLPHVDALIVEYWPAGLRRAGGDRPALHRALCSFPHAAVLSQQPDAIPTLLPTPALVARLDVLLSDDDPGFFDLILRR